MANLRTFRWIFSLVLVVVVTLGVAQGQDNGTVNDDGKSTMKEDPLLEGMKPFFKFINMFIESLSGSGDDMFKFVNNTLKINVNLGQNQTFDNIGLTMQREWGNALKLIIGFAVCVFIGILYFICFPFVGCIVCCCRCCDNCGGRNPQPKTSNKCTRVTCTGIFFIFTLAATLAVIISYLGAELTRRNFQQGNQNSFMNSMSRSLTDVGKYLNTTAYEIDNVVFKAVDKSIKDIDTAVENIPQLASANAIKGNGLDLHADMQTLVGLAVSLKAINASLYSIESSKSELQTKATVFYTKLTTTKTAILATLNSCGAQEQAACTTARNTYFTNWKKDADYSTLPSVATQRNRVESILNQNFQKKVDDTEAEYKKIAARVKTQTDTKKQDVKDELAKVRDNAFDNINTTNQQISQYSKQDFNTMFRDRQSGKDIKELLQKFIAEYAFYGLMAVTSLVAIIVVFFLFGSLFGMFGSYAGENASGCNKGVGANCILAGGGCAVLYAWLIMIIAWLMFMTGTLTHNLVCQTLVEPEKAAFLGVMDKQMGELTSSLPFQIHARKFLMDCKQNKPLLQAVQFTAMSKLDSQLSLKNYDLDGKLTTMTTVTPVVQDIDVLPTTTANALTDVKDLTLDNIPFGTISGLAAKASTNPVLSTILDQLTTLERMSGTATTKTQLQAHITSVKGLQTDAAAMKTIMTSIATNAKTVESEMAKYKNNTFSNGIVQLRSRLLAAKTELQSKGNDAVKKSTKDAGDKVYQTASQAITNVKYKLENEVGKCRPLYTFTKAMINGPCVKLLQPFNAYWFGLASALALIFILSCHALCLSAIYREDPEYEGYHGDHSKSFDEPQFSTYHRGQGAQKRGSFEYQAPPQNGAPPKYQEARGGYPNNAYRQGPQDYHYGTAAPPNPPHYNGNRY